MALYFKKKKKKMDNGSVLIWMSKNFFNTLTIIFFIFNLLRALFFFFTSLDGSRLLIPRDVLRNNHLYILNLTKASSKIREIKHCGFVFVIGLVYNKKLVKNYPTGINPFHQPMNQLTGHINHFWTIQIFRWEEKTLGV